MSDQAKIMTREIWSNPPRSDGVALWGWRVLHKGQVIALGECTNESFAQRAAEAAAKNHGRPLPGSP